MAVETVIRANQRGLALSEAYARRELLYFLVWRDIKVRYRQTVIGVAWAVLVPVIQLVIFSVFFGWLAGIKPDGDYPYALFVFTALVPWTMFSQSIAQGGMSLANQQQLLTKVYFPRLFIPTAAVALSLIDLIMSLGVLAALLAWYGYAPSAQIVFLPALVGLSVLASLGAAYLLSALTVAYRDFGFILPVMVQVLMFVSPVIYPVALVPEQYQWLLGLNPMTGIIDGFRSAVLGKPWNVPALLSSSVCTLVLLLAGAMYFRRTERRFADIA